MNIAKDFTDTFINLNYSRFEEEEIMNKVLIYILIETKGKLKRVRQKDVIIEFNSTKYKMGMILSYLDGAGLIKIDRGLEYSYSLTEIAEAYLKRYFESNQGQKLLKEAKYE